MIILDIYKIKLLNISDYRIRIVVQRAIIKLAPNEEKEFQLNRIEHKLLQKLLNNEYSDKLTVIGE